MLKPLLKWAQDVSHVFVTIEVRECKAYKVEFKSRGFTFVGTSAGVDYDYSLDLYEEIAPVDRETYYDYSTRGIFLCMRKRDSLTWWPRLSLESLKLPNVSVDFSRWVEFEPMDCELRNTPDDEFSDIE